VRGGAVFDLQLLATIMANGGGTNLHVQPPGFRGLYRFAGRDTLEP
jgi:hypothetical protein